MPGQPAPSFSLTTTFMPQGDRPVLAGFMAVDANAGNADGKKRAGYGAMRLLELPRDTTVKGPGQVQNDIESSNIGSPRFTQTLSQFLTLNRTQQGSQITLGNQLTLPVGGGLLYVEPIYVSAKTGSSYPLLPRGRGRVRQPAGVVRHPRRRPGRPLRRQLGRGRR